MRASSFWNSVPECPREKLQEMSHLEKMLMSLTHATVEALVAWNVDSFSCAQGRAALLGFMNIKTFDERHMGMIER